MFSSHIFKKEQQTVNPTEIHSSEINYLNDLTIRFCIQPCFFTQLKEKNDYQAEVPSEELMRLFHGLLSFKEKIKTKQEHVEVEGLRANPLSHKSGYINLH